MAIQYKNVQTFVKNTIHPYIVNLRDLWKKDVAWLKALIDDLDARLTQNVAALNARIDALRQELSDRIDALADSFGVHEQRRDNPHEVKMIQTVYGKTTFATPPSESQGEVGDVYIEHIDN